MRKFVFRTALRSLRLPRPNQTFDLVFDDVPGLQSAVRAFRRHGYRIAPGRSSPGLILTLPASQATQVRVSATGGVR